MAKNAKNDAFVFLLLLAFLLFATFPVVAAFAYYSGALAAAVSVVNFRAVSVAATAGIFIIPAAALIFVLLASVAPRLRKFAAAVRKPAKYPWETGVFAPEREFEIETAAVVKPSKPVRVAAPLAKPAFRFNSAAAAVIVAAVVAVAILLAVTPGIKDKIPGFDFNVTKLNATSKAAKPVANISPALPPAAEKKADEKAKEEAVKKIETKAEGRPFNLTGLSSGVKSAAKKSFAAVKRLGSNVKGKAAGLFSATAAKIEKVPERAWQISAVVAVVILLAVTVFYSRRTGQLGQIPEWLRGWLDWLKHVFAAAWKNKVKVVLAAAVIVAAAIATAFVFGKRLEKLGIKLPELELSAVWDKILDALFAVRDFVSVYRLYILIGIFALLVIVSVLFVLEQKGKREEKA